MKQKIADFIKGNRIAAICCVGGNGRPHCFHCFYAFDENHWLMFFKSSPETLHSKLLSENPGIAGSILPEKVEIFALKGVQLSGHIRYEGIPGPGGAEAFYHKKFPFARTKRGDIWCIQLETVKMTDNTKFVKTLCITSKSE